MTDDEASDDAFGCAEVDKNYSDESDDNEEKVYKGTTEETPKEG